MRFNNFFCSFSIILMLMGLPLITDAHSYQSGKIKIIHPWAMPAAASMHGGASGMGFLVLRNIGHQPDKLRSVSTAIAKQVELHHYSKDIQPTMRQTTAMDIPAGVEVRLEPGGSHLMLIGLQKPLVEGDHFPITLQFEHAGKITIDMFVQLKAKEATY